MAKTAQHRGDNGADHPTRGPSKRLTPKEFGEGVKDYFETCRAEDRPPTLAGLSFHLGFSTRQSVHDYAKDPDYAYESNRALLGIETWLSEKVVQKETFTPGQIFTLKSVFGYEDKQSIEQTTTHNIGKSLAERLAGGSLE